MEVWHCPQAWPGVMACHSSSRVAPVLRRQLAGTGRRLWNNQHHRRFHGARKDAPPTLRPPSRRSRQGLRYRLERAVGVPARTTTSLRLFRLTTCALREGQRRTEEQEATDCAREDTSERSFDHHVNDLVPFLVNVQLWLCFAHGAKFGTQDSCSTAPEESKGLVGTIRLMMATSSRQL